MTKTEDTKRKTSKAMSLEAAELYSWLANWALVASLVVGVLSTYAIVKTGEIKESYLKAGIAEAAERAAELQKQAGEAQVEIEEARASAAEANASAAEANAKALEAALELEKYRAPRTLTDERLAVVREKIAAFPGTGFVSGLTPGSLESAVLLARIESAMTSAGWKHNGIAGQQIVINRIAKPAAASVTVANIVVGFPPASEEKLSAPVLALANALNDEGLKVTAERMTDRVVNPMNELDIHLMVGPKQ